MIRFLLSLLKRDQNTVLLSKYLAFLNRGKEKVNPVGVPLSHKILIFNKVRLPIDPELELVAKLVVLCKIAAQGNHLPVVFGPDAKK